MICKPAPAGPSLFSILGPIMYKLVGFRCAMDAYKVFGSGCGWFMGLWRVRNS